MTVERVLVVVYLLGCIGIGVFASRKVLASRDEYWVAGRRIGTTINAMAIMASLASGGIDYRGHGSRLLARDSGHAGVCLPVRWSASLSPRFWWPDSCVGSVDTRSPIS